MRRQWWSLPGVLTLVLLAAGRADAHALGVECKLAGPAVALEAYYDDDTEARGAKVRVEDEAKVVVAEGRTDAEGRWSFPRPRPGSYQVIVDAGAGHRKQVTITIPPGDPAPAPPTVDRAVEPIISAITITDQPNRAAFTGVPWLKLALGLSILGALTVAFLVSRGRRATGR